MIKEEIKNEITKRMKLLQLDKEIIKEFQKSDIIYVSNIGRSDDNLTKVNEEQSKMIRKYEQERKVKIYHLIHQETCNKDITYFLYVTDDEKRWKDEKRDIGLGYDLPIIYKKVTEYREIGISTKEGRIVYVY